MVQHYLLRATSLRVSSPIVRGGFRPQSSGREEFRFAERPYNTRHIQYLRGSGGRKGVWIPIDARVAVQNGCKPRLLPTDVGSPRVIAAIFTINVSFRYGPMIQRRLRGTV